MAPKTKLPTLSAAIAVLYALTLTASAQIADTIYHGGTIITVNDEAPSAEALAVKDGKH